MAAEVVVTSAPRGVKLGRTGFQVVMRTAGMREDVTGTLEQLGDYRHVHPQGSGRNPTIYTFRRVRSFVGELSALVRSVDAGNDFSGRSNKLTHVVALGAAEIQSLGRATPPALLAALESDGTLVSAWPGGPEERPSGPRLPPIASEARRCDRWAEQTGDAGWAGVIAERALRGAATLVVAPDCSPASSRMVLDLFDEVYALLTPSRRWEIPFDTTLVAAGSPATLRGTYAGSPESATPGTALVVELAGRPQIPPEFETSDLVATARTGAARLGPATGRASSGPRPPGPLPVPGGPPLGPSLGHPEGGDPLGFDNLLTGAGVGPPPIPGGPPAPPLPTKGIGHRVGDSARDGDEDAEPRYRNPAMLSAVIVASLLLIMALGIVVYAAIKLHQRQNAIKALSEIAKAEPAAAANPDEPAKKQGESPLALVNKALWPNTDWWYFRDPVVLDPDKVSRFVALLEELQWDNTDIPHELLSLWRAWDRIGTWDTIESVEDLKAAIKPKPLTDRLTPPVDVDLERLQIKPKWANDSKMAISLADVHTHIQGLEKKDNPPASPKATETAEYKTEHPDRDSEKVMAGESPKQKPVDSPADRSTKLIYEYAVGKAHLEPSKEDWEHFPYSGSNPPFGLTKGDLCKLLNSILRTRQNGWKDSENYQKVVEQIQNEVLHSLLQVLFKKDDKSRGILTPSNTTDFVAYFRFIGIDTDDSKRNAFQTNLNEELSKYEKTFQQEETRSDKSVRAFIGTLDVEKLKELLKPPMTNGQSATSPTGSTMPEKQPNDSGPSHVDVGTPSGEVTLRDLLLDGRAEITFPVKHNSDAEKAITARMDTKAIQIIKHLGFDYSFPDEEGEPNTVIALTEVGVRGNKKSGYHCLEDFDKSVFKSEIGDLFLRLQQSEAKIIEWLEPEKKDNRARLRDFFPNDGCGKLEPYIDLSANPTYVAILEEEAAKVHPLPDPLPPEQAKDEAKQQKYETDRKNASDRQKHWVATEEKKFTRVRDFWFDNYCSAEPEIREKDASVKGSSQKDPESEFRKWTQTVVLLDWIKNNINTPLVDIVFPTPPLPAGPK